MAIALLIVGSGGLVIGWFANEWSNGDGGNTESAALGTTGGTRTEAEALAIRHTRERAEVEVDIRSWLDKGFLPVCEAKERDERGWLVVCGMHKPATTNNPEQTFPQLATFIVAGDGTVTSTR